MSKVLLYVIREVAFCEDAPPVFLEKFFYVLGVSKFVVDRDFPKKCVILDIVFPKGALSSYSLYCP